jgi:hypothetical protein
MNGWMDGWMNGWYMNRKHFFFILLVSHS